MPILDWQDGQINYTDEGRGTAVILLHGFCESIAVWDDWQEELIEEGYRVIRIDLPGFGASTASARQISEYSAAVAVVCQKAKLKKAVCVGHSMGGYIGLDLAEKSPPWLIGLGLFHAHPYADNAEQQQARFKSIDFIERNGHVHYVKQLIPRLFARDAGTSASFRRDLLILRASRSGAKHISNALHAMANRKDYSDWLSNYPKPVLFINGLKDPIYTEQQRQNQLALPRVADVCILPRAGHMGMIEEARETQRAVRHFALLLGMER